MGRKALEVSNYSFTHRDKLFLDANIWWYVYGSQKPDDTLVNIYSQVLDRILKAQSCIYIDVLIVSEFINTYARTQWKLVAPRNQPFKKFRESSKFKPIAKEIADAVKRIMCHCSRVESGFQELEIDALLNIYAEGNSDFNDQIIVGLCKARELTLISHDGDFKNQRIKVLTANHRILN